jgi:hypothetical protein
VYTDTRGTFIGRERRIKKALSLEGKSGNRHKSSTYGRIEKNGKGFVKRQ